MAGSSRRRSRSTRGSGHGFVESIYENALVLELRARELPFQRQLSVLDSQLREGHPRDQARDPIRVAPTLNPFLVS
ncbi:MAG: GxxExxY protein [Myxococcales bacterium]